MKKLFEMSSIILEEDQLEHNVKTNHILDRHCVFLDTSIAGSGKTPSACKIMYDRNVTRAIVVCNNSLQAAHWDSHKIRYNVPIVQILSYDTLRGSKCIRMPDGRMMVSHGLLYKSGDDYYPTETFMQWVEEGLCLVSDECHSLKNKCAKTCAFRALSSYITLRSLTTPFPQKQSFSYYISMTPFDKEEHCINFALTCGVIPNEVLYCTTTKQPYSLKFFYEYCKRFDSVTTERIWGMYDIKEKNAAEVAYRLITDVFLVQISSFIKNSHKGYLSKQSVYYAYFNIPEIAHRMMKIALNMIKSSRSKDVTDYEKLMECLMNSDISVSDPRIQSPISNISELNAISQCQISGVSTDCMIQYHPGSNVGTYSQMSQPNNQTIYETATIHSIYQVPQGIPTPITQAINQTPYGVSISKQVRQAASVHSIYPTSYATPIQPLHPTSNFISDNNQYNQYNNKYQQQMMDHFANQMNINAYDQEANAIFYQMSGSEKQLKDRDGVIHGTITVQTIKTFFILIGFVEEIFRQIPNVKIVIFLNYKEGINIIMRFLAKYNPMKITGDSECTEERRNYIVSKFNEPNLDCRLLTIISQIGSDGIELDDKNGNFPHVGLAFPDFYHSRYFQCPGRLLRRYTLSNSLFFFCLAYSNEYSEESIQKSIIEKSKVMEETLRNNEIIPPANYLTIIDPHTQDLNELLRNAGMVRSTASLKQVMCNVNPVKLTKASIIKKF